MITYIALFRGINVGGKNMLPMKGLVELLNTMGFKDVQTYIQSGNVIFSTEVEDLKQLSSQISLSVKEAYNFEPKIHILTVKELEVAIKNNPFLDSESDPKSLHFGFLLEEPIAPDLEKLEEIKKENERFKLIGKVFYLSAPEGVGRSKLASKSEKLLGVSMTDRNWGTVSKLRRMVDI